MQKRALGNSYAAVVTAGFAVVGALGLWMSSNPVPVVTSFPVWVGWPLLAVALAVLYTVLCGLLRRVRDANLRFQALVEAGSRFVWTADAEGRLQQSSVAFDQLTQLVRQGTSPGAAIWLDLVHPEERPRAETEWLRSRQQYSVLRDEFRLAMPGGQYRYFHVRIVPVMAPDGTAREWIGACMDIHDRIIGDLEVRGSANRLRAILDAEPLIVGVLGIDGNVLEINAAALRLAGLSRADVVGRLFPDTWWWSSDRRAREFIADAIVHAARGEPVRAETMIRSNDGDAVWIDFSLSPIRDTQGRITYLIPVGIDVTDRHRLDDSLRTSEENLRLAVDGANIGLWEWRLAGDRVSCSPHALERLGYHDDELPQTLSAFLDLLHPEDGERVVTQLSALRQAGKGEYRGEFRMRHRDGGWRWMLARASLLNDLNGQPDRLLGALLDISDRKRAEDDAVLKAKQQTEVAMLGIQALSGLSAQEVMQRASRSIAQMLQVDLTLALEQIGDGGRLLLRAGEGWTQGLVGTLLFNGSKEAFAGFVMQSSQAVLVGELGRETRFSVDPTLKSANILAGIATPLRGAGGAYGVLAAFSRSPRRFNGADLAFVQSMANVVAGALDRARHEQQLFRLAHIDELTQLPNRRFMRERLNQFLRQAQPRRDPLALLLVNLDRFRRVKDTRGAQGADALLKAVAQRIAVCLNPGDVLCRVAEDEFAIVLFPLPGADWASSVAQTLIDLFAESFSLSGDEVFVTASVGISVYPDDAADADTLMRHANVALSRAKQSGGHSLRVYAADMEREALRRTEIQLCLEQALGKDEMRLVYQPQVDLASGNMVAIEALLRWRSSQLGEVAPNEFLPVAESAGFIDPIGQFVLRSACRQARLWREQGQASLRMAVNISARQFYSPGLAEALIAAVQHAQLPPAAIEIEISETDLMEDVERSAKILESLRERGFRIIIDDVGTGYSNLSQMKRLPIDALKIDRSFVKGIETNPADTAVVRSVISLAQAMELKVIAEGVETSGQREFLRKHGCDYAQGLYFSPPVPSAALAPLLTRGRV